MACPVVLNREPINYIVSIRAKRYKSNSKDKTPMVKSKTLGLLSVAATLFSLTQEPYRQYPTA